MILGGYCRADYRVDYRVTPCKIRPFEDCSKLAAKFWLTVILSPCQILCYMYNIDKLEPNTLIYRVINHPTPPPFISNLDSVFTSQIIFFLIFFGQNYLKIGLIACATIL